MYNVCNVYIVMLHSLLSCRIHGVRSRDIPTLLTFTRDLSASLRFGLREGEMTVSGAPH